jgi:hypothetical protein
MAEPMPIPPLKLLNTTPNLRQPELSWKKCKMNSLRLLTLANLKLLLSRQEQMAGSMIPLSTMKEISPTPQRHSLIPSDNTAKRM